MDDEKRIIKLIETIIQRAGRSFESDSETFTIDNTSLLITMDEFSKEDNFRLSNPFVLGNNFAAGSISDILACGGIPLYYAHSMVICHNWNDHFIQQFSKGIADVLKRADITFLGGDLGKSETWHYTATVIGKAPERPVKRKGAQPGDSIYITGRIGTGNLEAALHLYAEKHSGNKIPLNIMKSISNKFILRLNESQIISRYASSCIDTSDGVFNALNEIAEINHTGYKVNNLPYIKKGKMIAGMLSLPFELLFLGECGEYELLFTIPPDKENEYIQGAKKANLDFYKIGIMTNLHYRTLTEKKKKIDLTKLKIRARDYQKKQEYINALIQWLEKGIGNDETE